ncbi:hypothetical protein GRF61_10405 [Azoarcus sp. TTM-91]|uniref:hypothetical protein n=1 Tax=Azoarcus sp. TTM-91 TaxID=2691581 RepID=UPI00145D6AB7|nr:hypothetical protein [Azoarcus sp. TTM-91]NMG34852.1 hypothetical protein [Azoarcus sp. TTM-91]
MRIRYAFVVIGLFISSVHAQTVSFNRFTDDLPQLLETDAVTVMVRSLMHDFAGKLCARLSNATGGEAQEEAEKWRARNDAFIRGASSVLNEFGDRYLQVGGESAKQEYSQMILLTAVKEANRRVMRQLDGANLDNAIVPPERACYGLAQLLNDRVADFERSPETTRALVPYMERKGIR